MVLKTIRKLFFVALLLLSACNGNPGTAQEVGIPTDTLAPIVSMTPRFTATPVSSRTPLPTFTPTPSDTPITATPSDTPTPSSTPPVTGIIESLQTVNVREGPGVNFNAIKALTPGTGVQILGQTDDGRWLNIRMDDGTEGWISITLVHVNAAPTLEPTATPSPNLTAIALGTPLPTAVIGGGTVTPTPPREVVSPTPIGTPGTPSASQAGPTSTFSLPIIDVTAIQETATALAGGIQLPQFTATFTPLANVTAGPTIPVIGATFTPSGSGSEGSTGSQQGVDVLAYCDDKSFGRPAPTNLNSGATIDVFWSWFASTQQLIQQHIDNVVYDVKVDGVALQNWKEYRTPTRKQADGNYYAYWFVPYGPLNAGQHTITYAVTWNAEISDGYNNYGPGTDRTTETGTCNFTVH